MDKSIKKAKVATAHRFDKLLKEDKKRDAKCEHDEKMAKAKSGKRKRS